MSALVLVMSVILCLLVGLVEVLADNADEQNYWLLPRLFEVDGYEECLSHPDGLYCLGTFHLTPAETPNHVYDLIMDYSKDLYRFNRTLIHRGYCVSARTPNSTDDVVERFTNCAKDWARALRFNATLHKMEYCRKHQDINVKKYYGWPEVSFLVVIAFIFSFNIVGTIYDRVTRNKEKKIAFLLAWSVNVNWEALTETDSRSIRSPLRALQGVRVMIAFCACVTHSALIYHSLFPHDSRSLETLLKSPYIMPVLNSTSIVQMLIVLSSYLCAFSLLKASETFSIVTLLKVIARRIFRLSPVYLLVIAFAATFWPSFGDGPFWYRVTAESDICREKFWMHAMYINNIINPDKICLLPTWYMAVDIQMYILTAILTMVLVKLSKKALPILIILLVGSIALDAALAYKFHWKSMLYITTVTENVHSIFRKIPTVTRFYMSFWGNLPACFAGLILGHLSHFMAGKRINLKKHKCLLYLIYIVSLPCLICWVMLGFYIQYIDHPVFTAVYAALERSLFQIMCLFAYITFSVIGSSLMKMLAWQGWQTLAKLSLSVMMLHWCVALIIFGSSPQTLQSSSFYIVVVSFSVTFVTYLLAVPLTLLVELPMKKTFELIFK